MKSLVLKDLYNVGHTARSMLFIMAVLAVAFYQPPELRAISSCAQFYAA